MHILYSILAYISKVDVVPVAWLCRVLGVLLSEVTSEGPLQAAALPLLLDILGRCSREDFSGGVYEQVGGGRRRRAWQPTAPYLSRF